MLRYRVVASTWHGRSQGREKTTFLRWKGKENNFESPEPENWEGRRLSRTRRRRRGRQRGREEGARERRTGDGEADTINFVPISELGFVPRRPLLCAKVKHPTHSNSFPSILSRPREFHTSDMLNPKHSFPHIEVTPQHAIELI